jgi:phosphonate transport system ATP-binding protein
VIGMAGGKVVFDGPPDELTTGAVRMIYGASGDGTEISESITSTSISAGRPAVPAKPKSTGPLQPALSVKPAAAGIALPA